MITDYVMYFLYSTQLWFVTLYGKEFLPDCLIQKNN